MVINYLAALGVLAVAFAVLMSTDGIHTRIGACKKFIAERFDSEAPDQFDMLGCLICQGLDQDDITSQALIQIIAGSDNSSSIIGWLMLRLMSSPASNRRLQAEIDDAIATGRVSSPAKDAKGRSGISPGRCARTCRLRGRPLRGMYLPSGTKIGWSTLAMQRLKKTFGPDAEMFRPERWFEASEEQLARINSTVDLVFSYGKWQCLGSRVA
ncbi:hypothetical protein N0V88_007198 [Collariella sp. IMI 366227]|nr:hypothetical protein N0V88_007198 [Collariella sp. IMI 366227]